MKRCLFGACLVVVLASGSFAQTRLFMMPTGLCSGGPEAGQPCRPAVCEQNAFLAVPAGRVGTSCDASLADPCDSLANLGGSAADCVVRGVNPCFGSCVLQDAAAGTSGSDFKIGPIVGGGEISVAMFSSGPVLVSEISGQFFCDAASNVAGRPGLSNQFDTVGSDAGYDFTGDGNSDFVTLLSSVTATDQGQCDPALPCIPVPDSCPGNSMCSVAGNTLCSIVSPRIGVADGPGGGDYFPPGSYR